MVSALEKLLEAWALDWGLAQNSEEKVRCCMAFEEGHGVAHFSAPWNPVFLGGAAQQTPDLWWHSSVASRLADPSVGAAKRTRNAGEGDLLSVLLGALFDSHSEGRAAVSSVGVSAEVANEMAMLAWADLWRRIFHALKVSSVTEPPPIHPEHQPLLVPASQCFERWSGAVSVSLPWGGQDFRILLGGDEIQGFLRHAEPDPARSLDQSLPMIPVWQAVSSLPCVVRTELAPVELSLGAFKALRIGDIVELPHPLDQPLLIKTVGGGLVFEAFLGKVGAHRAVELLRAPTKPV
jgi:Type III flagellar switch regulator (C-ring) FliN C-term